MKKKEMKKKKGKLYSDLKSIYSMKKKLKNRKIM